MDGSGAPAEQQVSRNDDFTAPNDEANRDNSIREAFVVGKEQIQGQAKLTSDTLEQKVGSHDGVGLILQGSETKPTYASADVSCAADREEQSKIHVENKVVLDTSDEVALDNEELKITCERKPTNTSDVSEQKNQDMDVLKMDEVSTNLSSISTVDREEAINARFVNHAQATNNDQDRVFEKGDSKGEHNTGSPDLPVHGISTQPPSSSPSRPHAFAREESNSMLVENQEQVSDEEIMMVENEDLALAQKGDKINDVVGMAGPEPKPLSFGISCEVDRKESKNMEVVKEPATNDDEVVVIEKKDVKVMNQASEEEKRRARRKRKLKRLLRPGVIPSFIALISPDDDDSDEEKPPARIVVDVDEYLGLSKNPKPVSVKSRGGTFLPDAVASSLCKPADEGWYEGVVPMALPDEHLYLNDEKNRVIRSNMEFFSATASDVCMIQAGRRTPVVLGKVGIRCIHCAKAALGKDPAPDAVSSSSTGTSSSTAKLWPAGSISFPVNIAGLYPVVSQKPCLHFQNCPNLPLSNKTELYRVCHEASVNPKRQRKGGESKSISTVTYYAVAAKRLGLVDTDGGMRFSRDLALEPLPMEAARAQIEGKRPPQRKTSLAALPSTSSQTKSSSPRISADEDSERLLAEAIAENVDGGLILGRPEDHSLVSDFVFLCIKQMAICHAVPADLSARGKKTKSMRVGLAGFCCRHCSHIESTGYVPIVNFSCRSFSSAPDNLASAISNSFYSHLQKCFLVPEKMKRALAAFKRIHSRQLNQLPHGSQRRMFHVLWTRLRASDRTEAEMGAIGSSMSPPLHVTDAPANESTSSSGVHTSDTKSAKVGESSLLAGVPSNSDVPHNMESSQLSLSNDESRPPNFPVCKDEITQQILKVADEQDLCANDNLINPSEKYLITDFIYLIMKQLRVAHPGAFDFSRGRRSSVKNISRAGLCCKHCMEQDMHLAAGRSFPSQADNLASSLSTSLYHHMQKCPNVSDDLKLALANLKRMHPSQLSHLRFGSQRQFFHLVFTRLSEVELQELNSGDNSSPNRSDVADDETLASYGFINSIAGGFVCQNCRMVPLELRAKGSFSIERPTEGAAHRHKEKCKKDGFDLSNAAKAMEEMMRSCPCIKAEMLTHLLFKAVVRELVGGNEELVHVFTEGVVGMLKKAPNEELDTDAAWKEIVVTNRLWVKFPATVDIEKVAKAFESFAKDVAPGLDPCFTDNPGVVLYFQTISPSLVIPTPMGGVQE